MSNTPQILQKQLPVEAYRDGEGQPTCAIDFSKKKVCIFYRTQRFGCHETCAFAEATGKLNDSLTRYENTRMLRPLACCPIWNTPEPANQLEQVFLELRGEAQPVSKDSPLWSEAWEAARKMRLDLHERVERERVVREASKESLARRLDDAARLPSAQKP